MKKEFTLNELRGIKNILIGFTKVKSRAFSYAIVKNIAIVDKILHKEEKNVKEKFTENVEFDKKYLPALNELHKKYEDVSDGQNVFGKLIINNKEKEKQYETDFKQLSKKYPKSASEFDKRMDIINEIDKKKFEIKFYKIIDEDYLPEEISAEDRWNLYFMLDKKLIPKEWLELQDEIEADLKSKEKEENEKVPDGVQQPE